jgi:Domain of unknown function (DUF4150)
MGDKVFVNGRSAVHAGSAGKTICFPDVNLCPPAPPAGPIPLPLPNMAQGADLQSGASSVLIEDNPMAKKSSFIGKSTGNEVAQSTGGGVVSAVVQGKAYFTSYSLDVTVEGEEAPRHLDMLTHNHAGQSPPNSAMGTYLAMMDPSVIPPATEERPKRPDDKPQDIEFFLDHVQNKPHGAADSFILVSDDEAYNQTMAVSAATPKGGLLSLKFQKVLPGKGYSLFWKIGDEQIALFEDVAFADILEHTPGSEKPAAPAPVPQPDPNDKPDPPLDHPAEWYDYGPWRQK